MVSSRGDGIRGAAVTRKPLCGGVMELPAPGKIAHKAGVIMGKTQGKPSHHQRAAGMRP